MSAHRSGTRCLVVVPTYDAAATILTLLDGLLAATSGKLGKDRIDRIDVLVVDDDSPDGTGDLVEAHAEFGRRVNLLRRQAKEGGAAANRPLPRRAPSWAASTSRVCWWGCTPSTSRPDSGHGGRRVCSALESFGTTTPGCGFQVENTWRAERASLRITEHPITFVDARPAITPGAR